jgi:hypothetical protein
MQKGVGLFINDPSIGAGTEVSQLGIAGLLTSCTISEHDGVFCSLYHFSHPFPRFNCAVATASQLVLSPLVKTEDSVALLRELGIARNALAEAPSLSAPAERN